MSLSASPPACDVCIPKEAPSTVRVLDLHTLDRNSVQSQDAIGQCLFSPDSISEVSLLSSGERLDKNVDLRGSFFFLSLSPGTWIR